MSSSSTMTVASACTAIFLPGAMIFGFPGVMAPWWRAAFSAGQAEIGLIMFFMLAGAGCSMFFIGRLNDAMSPSILMGAGAVICGAGAAAAGFSKNMNWVYGWALLTGASSTFVYLPAITVVQLWFPKRRGLVSGLVGMFFGLAGAVSAPVIGRMAAKMEYRTLCIFLGIFVLIAGVTAAAFVRRPPVPAPGQSGLKTENPLGSGSLTLRQSLLTRSFWLIWLTYAFVGAAGISMVVLGTSFGLSRGMALDDATAILMAFNLTNGASRAASGYLSDLFGRKPVMIASFACAGMAYTAMPHLNGVVMCAVPAAVIGFAFGTLFAVSVPYVGDCFGMAHFGAIFGAIFAAYGFFAGILGPYFSGYLLDVSNGGFTLVFGYLAGLMGISSLMMAYTISHIEIKNG